MGKGTHSILYDSRIAQERRFWFDGKCSADFGIVASGVNVFNAPERDVEKVTVPGRDGDLILDCGSLKNISVQYPISFSRDFPERAAAAKNWLLSAYGYRRLTDSYDPECFRLAAFSGPIDFDTPFKSRTGESTLTFDCKPQLFLKSGEYPQRFIVPTVLFNSYFPSLPLIHVYGTGDGTITIGDITVQLFSMVDTITLDCDLQDAYRERNGILENLNGHISAPEFPVLQPGPNKITWSGGVERVEIIPRWWTL